MALGILASRGEPAPGASAILWKYTFALFVIRWVGLDRRLYDLKTPFEFNAFLFFAWMIVLPYYLYKTRGLRGLLNTLGFWLLAATPAITGQIMRLFSAH
ncbi:MAG TPA: hypothetical protein VLV88_15990 [Terriglobales bacterium]|nr:hypothetical protein [Terriglobales bacterium]